MNNENSNESRQSMKKREKKAEDKNEQSLLSIERKFAIRNSIGNHTDYSTFVDGRFT
jgi:hypothetical protein